MANLKRFIAAVRREADLTGESYAAIVNRAFAQYLGIRERRNRKPSSSLTPGASMRHSVCCNVSATRTWKHSMCWTK